MNWIRSTIASIRRKAPSELTYTVEVAGDLSAWDSGEDFTTEVSVTSIEATTEFVTGRDDTPARSATQRFIRPRVTR